MGDTTGDDGFHDLNATLPGAAIVANKGLNNFGVDELLFLYGRFPKWRGGRGLREFWRVFRFAVVSSFRCFFPQKYRVAYHTRTLKRRKVNLRRHSGKDRSLGEKRFCRWLLQTRDRCESDEIPLTQEFLAEMLGVQRTSVTPIARNLQAAGLIKYRRGRIDIIDRAGLESKSCECYESVRLKNEETFLTI